MSLVTLPLTAELYPYFCAISQREPPALAQLRQAAAALQIPQIQIAPEQAQLLSLLLKLMSARRTIEIGVLAGYSALAVALALPDNGQIIACDRNDELSAFARHHWQQAGVAHKIDLRIAPALETLDQLLAAGEAEQFDFVLIDADKRNYDAYYERSLQLVRPGGLIAIDNTLWSGNVANASVQDPQTQALRELNQKLHQDSRIDLSLIPLGDGMTLALKRAP